jgi:hypothetical protein
MKHGDTITVVTFEASTDTYQQEVGRWEKILASLKAE